MVTKKHSGSCLCGKIKFTFTAPLDDIWFCHCNQCRKNYGMYGAFVGIPKTAFKMTGAKHLRRYRSSAKVERTFCDICGSPITWEKAGYERLYILAGLLEGKPRIRGGPHIFVKDKGSYYRVCDGLPQFKTVPK